MSFSNLCVRACLLGGLIAGPISVAAQTVRVLHNFAGTPDGSYPLAPLTSFDGLLYGTTLGGGRFGNYGTIFTVDPTDGSERTVLSFTGKTGGSSPWSSLLVYNGKLYGTAETAAISVRFSRGSLFAFDPATKTRSTLHIFKSGSDGAFPLGPLIEHGGRIYGATVEGGKTGNGALFSWDVATGVEKVLHQFNGTDGDQPSGGVTYDHNALYGTTYDGGANNYGTVFKLDLATQYLTVVYSFTGGNDGGYPVYSGLLPVDGKFYGVARIGGTGGAGVVYEIDPVSGTETVLYNFTGGADGGTPICNLVYQKGAVYGVTRTGGAQNVGVVFKLGLASETEKVLTDLQTDGQAPDYGPNAGLLINDSALYGITTYGGSNDVGTVFKITP